MKKLIVLFPGIRYSTDMPLLYYGRLKYEERGYEVLHMNYDNTYKKVKTLEEAIEYGKEYALNKLNELSLKEFKEKIYNIEINDDNRAKITKELIRYFGDALNEIEIRI